MKLEVIVPVLTRFSLVGAFVVVCVLLSLVPNSARAEVPGCENARKQVTLVAGKVRQIMASKSGRRRRMTSIFRKYTLTRSMANFALGRYLRSLPPKYKSEYYRLAEKMLVHLFTVKMGPFNSRSYKIWNCKPKGRGFAIGGAIVEANGNIVIDVHWLMMPAGRSLRVADISVAHIWLRQEQRRAFRSVLSKNRGDFKGLLNYMRKEITSSQ